MCLIENQLLSVEFFRKLSFCSSFVEPLLYGAETDSILYNARKNKSLHLRWDD